MPRTAFGWGILRAAILVALLMCLATGFASAATAAGGKAELELEKLRQEVRQLKIENDRSGGLRDTILPWAPMATVLVAVIGLVFPITKEIRAQRLQREAELEQRQKEQESRFDDLFAQAVGNLASDSEPAQVSAAIVLRSFLRPEYENFHEQVYSVLCAILGLEQGRRVNRFVVRAFEEAIRLRIAALKDDPEAKPLDLAGCMLPRIDLQGLKLIEIDLAFATLRRANLRGAILTRARGIEVNLERAYLSDADLTEARFYSAVCREAHFHNARIISGEFRKRKDKPADFTGAEFFGAKLQGAHFDGAILVGAKFKDANLADAHFPGATFDDEALRSLLGAKIVDDVPTWKKAHFDPPVLATLKELASHRGNAVVTPAPADGTATSEP